MNDPNAENSLARLLKLAGERDLPSSESTERARVAAYAAWRAGVERTQGRRSPSRTPWLLAAAASVLLAAGWLSLRPTEVPSVFVAQVASVEGTSRVTGVTGVDGAPLPLTNNTQVSSGSVLTTDDGRVALLLGDTLALRVDRDTRVSFDAPDHISLLAGRLYVDSGGVNAVAKLRITTPAGEVRHVGTQFQVSVQDGATRISVREGRVVLTAPNSAARDIAAGEELKAVGDQVQLQRGLAAFGAAWEWSADIAPPMNIENRPLAEFLVWLTREHGWQLQYADAQSQQRAVDIRLHGSFERMSAPEMLERVVLITGVPVTEHAGVLEVGASGTVR